MVSRSASTGAVNRGRIVWRGPRASQAKSSSQFFEEMIKRASTIGLTSRLGHPGGDNDHSITQSAIGQPQQGRDSARNIRQEYPKSPLVILDNSLRFIQPTVHGPSDHSRERLWGLTTRKARDLEAAEEFPSHLNDRRGGGLHRQKVTASVCGLMRRCGMIVSCIEMAAAGCIRTTIPKNC